MIVLGTGNPVAARRYFAIGYRRLPGTNVWWNNVRDDRSPEECVMDSFRDAAAAGGSLVVAEGIPTARVRMLPLIHHPHDVLLSLDANVGLYSTRASVMTSVNGLYPRYANLVLENSGKWWTAMVTEEAQGSESGTGGTLVGLATACRSSETPDDEVWVDGFLHGKWLGEHWATLMQQGPLRWASTAGQFKRACARVPKQDAAKISLFQSLGFAEAVGRVVSILVVFGL